MITRDEALVMEPLTTQQLAECRALVEAGDVRAAYYLARLVLTVEDQQRRLEARARDLGRLTQATVGAAKAREKGDWEASRRKDGGH